MGSIQHRDDKRGGRYVARVYVGGKQMSKSFKLKREATEWIREREGLKPTGRRIDHTMLAVLLAEHAEKADEQSTRASRHHLAENIGDLGYKKLADVTSDDVREWRDQLAEGRPWADDKPLANSTISTLTSTLSVLFNEAVARGQIPRNPVTGVRRRKADPNRPIEPHEVLTTRQLKTMLSNADEPLRTMLELGATSGLRPNEIAGLRVRSVDFTRRVVDVVEQADGHYKTWGWTSLKSLKSRRTVPLPQSTLDAIKAHLDIHSDYEPHEPLFRVERTGQWSSAHMGRHWRKLAAKSGVTGHSWKSLRHFYASALINAGESVVVVQNRLGHASATVTLAVYSHLWPTSDAKTREVFDGLLT